MPKVVTAFTLPGGREAWGNTANAVKAARSNALNIKVEGDFAIIFAHDDNKMGRNVTVAVPVTDAIDGTFCVTAHIMNNVVIGKRKTDIRVEVLDDNTLSFKSGPAEGKDIHLIPLRNDLPEDAFTIPELDEPTFSRDDQQAIIASMRLAASRGAKVERLDVHVSGNDKRTRVGSVANSQVIFSILPLPSKVDFTITEDVLGVLSGMEREPFALSSTADGITIRTEGVTYNLPVIGASGGFTIEDGATLIKREVNPTYSAQVETKDLKAALAEAAVLFETNTATRFHFKPDSLVVSIDSSAGSMDVTCASEGGEGEKTLSLRGGDVQNLLSHLSGTLTFAAFDRGVKITSKDDRGTANIVFLMYYS